MVGGTQAAKKRFWDFHSGDGSVARLEERERGGCASQASRASLASEWHLLAMSSMKENERNLRDGGPGISPQAGPGNQQLLAAS